MCDSGHQKGQIYILVFWCQASHLLLSAPISMHVVSMQPMTGTVPFWAVVLDIWSHHVVPICVRTPLVPIIILGVACVRYYICNLKVYKAAAFLVDASFLYHKPTTSHISHSNRNKPWDGSAMTLSRLRPTTKYIHTHLWLGILTESRTI